MAEGQALWLWLRGLFTKRPPIRAGADAKLGAKGERIAARWLRGQGYKVIARNVRGQGGELDIMCLSPDRATMVAVEVKTRRLVEGVSEQVMPEVNVTYAKREKLVWLAKKYAKRKRWEGKLRIDVVTVQVPLRGKAVVRHLVDGVRRG